LHAETKSTAQVSHEYQLHEIVHGTVDPATSLRQKNLESIGNRRLANCLWYKDLLPLREGPQHQSREITIFSEKQQVLLVQGVDHVLGIVLDDVGIGKNRYPVILTTLGCLDAVHAETPGKTGYTTKSGLERFGEMVRDKVLKDLNRSDPALSFVGNLGFTTETHNLWVLDHCADHVSKTIREDFGIGVNHESDFVKVRRDSSNFVDAVEHFVFEFGHTFIKHDLLKERHEDDLTVALTTVSGLGDGGFSWGTTFDNDEHRNALLLLNGNERVLAIVVKSSINLGHVVTL